MPQSVATRPRFGTDRCQITINAKAATTFDIHNPALAPLADGDALVVCALNGEVRFHRRHRDTKKQRAVQLSLPECQRDRLVAVLLRLRHDGTVFLGGSRPGSDWVGDCSWLGQLIMHA